MVSSTTTTTTTTTTNDKPAGPTLSKRERFLSVWPRIQSELEEHLERNYMPEDAKAWFKRNMDYNVVGGKMNRGMSVVDTVEILRGSPLTDPEEYFEAALLGWGVELLQSFFLVSDDIMDSSITRRDQPCWYRVEKPARVGMIAINDAFLLEGSIYHLLKRHFKGRPYYADLLDLFHDMTYATEMGQLIDLITAPEDEVDLARFSLTKHRLIVLYKTAYYSFYLPVALAMMYSGVEIPSEAPMLARSINPVTGFQEATNGHTADAPAPTGESNGAAPTNGTNGATSTPSEPFQLALDILLPLGEYFQVQDDYLDCFGTDIGKIGTDILDNKCSWVICTALELASHSQRTILDANYGRKDSVCEARCKDVFEDLGLRARYETYEEAAYKRINALIERVDESPRADSKVGLKKEVFRSFLNKIYRRQK